MAENRVNPNTKIQGLLRVRIKRGINLAVRDIRSSDPYVILRLGKQTLKTSVIKKSLNPEWNEDLTLCVTDPNQHVKLFVRDHDTFSRDDEMGDAEFDIKPLLEAANKNSQDLPNDTIIDIVKPTLENCIAEESCIVWKDNRVIQNMFLRLRNVEVGEIELQVHWVNVPTSHAS